MTEQIQALESELGTKLFDRSRRKLRLTPAGQSFLEYARALLALADEAKAAVAVAAGEHKGTITIGSLETLASKWLPPFLSAFQEEQPGIALKLEVAGSGALLSGVRSGELDLCFAFERAAPEPDLLHARLDETRLVAILPPNHGLAERAQLSTAELAGEPFLVTEIGCVYRQMFEHVFPPDGAGRPRIVGEFGSIAAIQHMVEAGAGCAIVPHVAVSASAGQLAMRPLSDTPAPVPISMFWRRRRMQPPALHLLMDKVRQPWSTVKPGDVLPRHAAPFQ